MLMTGRGWPGWPEHPFLLLFVIVVVLAAHELLDPRGSPMDAEFRAADQPDGAPEGSGNG